MKQLELGYIRANYLTLDELSQKAGLDTQSILHLIEQQLIPEASYTLIENIEITSPLGDKVVYKSETAYYPVSTIKRIQACSKQLNSEEFKQLFKTNFRKHLEAHPDKAFAYENIFDAEGNLEEAAFEEAFESEWDAYIKGIYGICTQNATEEEIVKKEIAVKKLINFNKKHQGKVLNEEEKEILKALKEEFDQVASLFAPYQRETSSRGKYLDKILKENDLQHLIKQY